MATLTAAQIKTILESPVSPGYPDQGQEINAALMQNEERRKYPSIDVQNITGQEDLKDFPTKTTTQTFLVHLFYRYRSFGEQHEPDIKQYEDAIFNTIDQAADFLVPGVKVTVSQSWKRDSETFPVHRSHSILTVTAENIEATDGAGIPGDKITITFPTIGTLTVISLATDERSVSKQLDLQDDAERIFTKISNTDLLVVEVELTTTTEPQLETQVHATDDISVTLTKNGINQVLNVNLTNMIASATRDVVQTTLVTMDVKN